MNRLLSLLIAMLFVQLAFAQFQLSPSGTQHTLHDLHFFDLQTGIVVGDSGTVLKTTNGGDSWVPVSVPVQDEFFQVAFFDDSVGLCMGKHLLRTTDRGDSWSTIGMTSWRYYDIEIRDTQTAYVSSPDVGLIRTQDQGLTWDTLQLSNPDDAIGLLSFPNATVGYACRYGNGPNGKLLKTVDGGVNWQELIMQSGSDITVLEAIEFLDEQTGFMGGWYNAYLAKTTNGGHDWARGFNNDSLNGGQVIDFCFPTPTSYYACGWHNLIMHSTDGGENWIMLDPGLQSSQTFFGIFFHDAYQGWVVGTGGTILKIDLMQVGLDNHPEPDLYLRIYPNPTSRKVYLSASPSLKVKRVSVFSHTGAFIGEYLHPQSIDLNESGAYILRIQTNQGNTVRRIVIE